MLGLARNYNSLRNHAKSCNQKPKLEIRQYILLITKMNADANTNLATFKFDPFPEVERIICQND